MTGTGRIDSRIERQARLRWVLLTVERTAARGAHRNVCVCEANATEALALRVTRPDQLRVVSIVDSSVSVHGPLSARPSTGSGVSAWSAPEVTSLSRACRAARPSSSASASSS